MKRTLPKPVVAFEFEAWFKANYPGKTISMQNEGPMLVALELPDFTTRQTTAILKKFAKREG